jgi:hypothetical protein
MIGCPGRHATVANGRTKKAVSPLLGEFPGTSKDDWHLRVADAQSAKHVCEPGTPSRLGSEQVRVIAFDDDRATSDLGKALHLE